MNAIKNFGRFWYHFIVGDDVRIAMGVVAGLAVTVWLVHGAHVNAWWLLPVIVPVMLSVSLWRATRP